MTLQQRFDVDNNQLVLSIENGLAEDFFYQITLFERGEREIAQVHHALMVSTNMQIGRLSFKYHKGRGFDRGHLAML